jgi:CRP-like cAMP-binding protein
MPRDEENHYQVSSADVQVLRRLLALSVIEGKKQSDQVRLLAVAGLDRHEIAELVGTTPLTVSVLISNMRKKGVIRGKKRK